jgi:hypothetical protein
MRLHPAKSITFVLAVSCAMPLAAPDIKAYAQPLAAAGAFSRLTGSWSGSGTISIANGTNEQIRCRAGYRVDPTGAALQQTLRCASDSYRFDVSSNLVDSGGVVSGSWSESNHNVTGSFTGRVQGGAISGTITGPNFNASLGLSTRGDQQFVTIRPQSGTDIRAVSVRLHKS